MLSASSRPPLATIDNKIHDRSFRTSSKKEPITDDKTSPLLNISLSIDEPAVFPIELNESASFARSSTYRTFMLCNEVSDLVCNQIIVLCKLKNVVQRRKNFISTTRFIYLQYNLARSGQIVLEIYKSCSRDEILSSLNFLLTFV
jgi:hypothetical protein